MRTNVDFRWRHAGSERDGTNRPYRCKLRAPSSAHLQTMDLPCRGHLVAEVLGSIDIVLGRRRQIVRAVECANATSELRQIRRRNWFRSLLLQQPLSNTDCWVRPAEA
ncbi:hypothetical protein FJW06_21105 [Mesorhizobium sp. B4-1-3]|nr:hypothetical protein FJW06_21105 [Mesorhizobium sp. B4-1-3]